MRFVQDDAVKRLIENRRSIRALFLFLGLLAAFVRLVSSFGEMATTVGGEGSIGDNQDIEIRL